MCNSKICILVVYRFNLPKKDYFRRESDKVYLEVNSLLKEQLKDIEFFAATTDMWTSRTNTPFMGFTIHYIDNDYNLQAKALEVIHLHNRIKAYIYGGCTCTTLIVNL